MTYFALVITMYILNVFNMSILTPHADTKTVFHFQSVFPHQRFEISSFLTNTADHSDGGRQSADGRLWKKQPD